EARGLGKLVLVMRETTERPEAVTAGTVRLIGTAEERVYDEVTTLLTDDAAYQAMAAAVNPYGDGKAGVRTVSAIAELLGVGERMAPLMMASATGVSSLIFLHVSQNANDSRV